MLKYLGSERVIKLAIVLLIAGSIVLAPVSEILQSVFSPPAMPFTAQGEYRSVEVDDYVIGVFTKYRFHSSFELSGDTPLIAGGWNGPLPPKDARVIVASPTGYMRDVVITEIESGKTYRSQGLSLWPDKQPFEYRVTLRATGEVLCEGIAEGFNHFDATERARCENQTLYDMSFYDTYVVQVWDQGSPAPPYLK